MAATPFSKVYTEKGLNIIPHKDDDPARKEVEDENLIKAINEFTKELESHNIEKNVEIHEAPVYPEKNLLDWQSWRKILAGYLTSTNNTPHIIFLAAVKRIPPIAMRIQHTVHTLTRECVVITNAVGTKGRGGPTAFPSDSVIAVSDSKDGPCGSTVDFLVPSEDSWISAMKTVAIIARVLVKAQMFGKKLMFLQTQYVQGYIFH